MKILWLISNPVWALPFKKRLEIEGHECDVVRTCEEGQHLFDKNDYDLVLSTVGTACGRNASPEYTPDIPVVRTFHEINKLRIKKHVFLTFAPNSVRAKDEVDMMRLADTRGFLEFITTECREECREGCRDDGN